MTVPAPPGPAAVTDLFGVVLTTKESPVGLTVDDLVQLALRRNPRRAHLLVSTVLGKHIPVDPRVVVGTGRLLGSLVDRVLRTAPDAAGPAVPAPWSAALRAGVDGTDPAALLEALPPIPTTAQAVIVLGYAETATSLGHLVADQLGARWYLHSTRRPVPGVPLAATFEEGHSHATSHLLLPIPATLLNSDGPLVLVDDEISTGRTARATIAELHRLHPRPHYVLAALIDLRDAASEYEMAGLAARLNTRIDVVSLARGEVELPAGLAARVAASIGRAGPGAPFVAAQAPDRSGGPTEPVRVVEIPWPAELPDGGRHGWSFAHAALADAAVQRATQALRPHLGESPGHRKRILVVGTEEFMYLPLRISLALSGDARFDVEFQSTTRSPVHPMDLAEYPIRRGYVFHSSDSPDTDARYLYNARGARSNDPDLVLLLADGATDISRLVGEGGPARALTDAGLAVLVGSFDPTVPLPRPLVGPSFGSYRPDEVSWLLTDLSHLDLEGDVAQRERLIQSGQAHYAESLPREFQPDARYRRLFDDVLDSSAARLAEAVGLVTELVLAERGHDIVLASLARAGTPVGILMRRWAAFRHGIELPHFAVSIVRGRGIDRMALKYLASHHDPKSVVFVDGWTGKGAITKELTAALRAVAAQGGPDFNDDLAVLADPGHCVRTFGTRDDFLIASACLNSTVSGLISRTVLNPDHLRPDQFHGAKFYRELAGDDVSGRLLDAVSARFPAVVEAVIAGLGPLAGSDREVTFAGWAAIERIRAEYGIESVNFVKPGVGETTRVLLRRVPWRILLRESDNPDHHHLRLLAEERSVIIEIRPGLPYSCIGLIRPLSATDQGEG